MIRGILKNNAITGEFYKYLMTVGGGVWRGRVDGRGGDWCMVG